MHPWTTGAGWPITSVPTRLFVAGSQFRGIRRQEQTRIVHSLAHMQIILASASETRLALLSAAGLQVTALPARIDEESMRAALEAEEASPLDIADALAEAKARKLAERHREALVIGCDQVLAFQRQVWGKPETPEAARRQLRALRGQTHRLLSAVVLYEAARPVWRHVGEVRLTMRDFSDDWLEGYLARNWDSVKSSVGGYKLEEEGVRLFTDVEGDYFTVLGLPLLPLLTYLGQRGFIPT
ncbi:septum formation protein [Cereibacter changlensis]|nr:septum formation protein [Cereibacter changlensis]